MSCPYRSNFRSDVVRHIRHKHPTVESSAGVSKLDAASAAASLTDYMNTWARKKFVPHARRRRCRLLQERASTSVASSPVANPITQQTVTLSAPYKDANSESPRKSGSEDELVIVSGSEDSCDVVIERGRHGDADQQKESSRCIPSEPVSSMCVCPLPGEHA